MVKFSFICGLIFSLSAFAGLKEVKNFGENQGGLKMFVYTPKNVRKNAPLMVLLHGCAQTAQNYYEQTGFGHIAEQTGAMLLVPEQNRSNNIQSCFNWFQPGDITRGKGEAASIVEMVKYLQKENKVSKKRVFVTGLSAGGAMSAVMMAAYPDVFAGGGLVAGIPYGCARSMIDGFTCMRSVNKSAEQWKKLVTSAYRHRGSYPRVIIFQGTSDPFVSPNNANELLEQWGSLHKVGEGNQLEDNRKMIRTAYKNEKGRIQVETVLLKSMGHGHPIDSSVGCGNAGAWIIDHGVCAADLMAKFFKIKK